MTSTTKRKKKPSPKNRKKKKQKVEDSIRDINHARKPYTEDTIITKEINYLKKVFKRKHDSFTQRDLFRELLIDQMELEKRVVVAVEEVSQVLQQFGTDIIITPIITSYIDKLSDLTLLKRMCMAYGFNAEETTNIMDLEISNKFRKHPLKTTIVTTNKNK